MDFTSLGTSAIAVIALVGLLIWQRHNVTRIYLNVILMTAIMVAGFTATIGLLLAVGAGQIILPLTSLVATIFIGIAAVYSKRAAGFKGVVSPLNVSALIVFVAAIALIMIGVRFGLDPFLQAQENSVLAAAAGLADSAKGAAVNTLMLLLTPLFTGAGAVVMNFATRDADAGEDSA